MIALITGGASGFGAEVARQLVRRGDAVVLVDIDEAGGQAVADEVGGHFLRCDVSDFDQVMATTEAAEQIHGGLDLVFLNAGISSGCGVADDFDLLKYRRAMGINLDGVVFGAHAAIPALRRRGGGSIVATASMAGLTATSFDPIYGANKHAVVGLVRALGPALAHENIRVNAFCPGFAETKIITDIRTHLNSSGVPIIGIDVAGRAILQAFDSPDTGQAWLLQAGREPMQYKFRGIPGPLDAEGNPARPVDPTGVPMGMG
ncbi:MAG TPA: SDR family NAD(P)-dependent oxidoreductase [Mycobacteriales bacterium]|jgi:NAD(P)-dependent dehydrogenase (short-subunit alcohol dehydrogenase family)|nr:SDR family NAD(P)-dependent oxidoreductase [Mycobacteriales bacterium]